MELHAASLIRSIYRRLLHLYPVAFRGEFAEEMADVFSQVVAERQEGGSWPLTEALLREMADLPGTLLHAYWEALHPREDTMSQALYLGEMLDAESYGSGYNGQPGTWRQAALAAAPLLYPLLLLALPQLLVLAGVTTWDSRWLSTLQAFIGVTGIVCLLAALVVAWRKKWPAWSAAWYVYFWVLAFIPALWLSSLLEDRSSFADVFSELFGFFLAPMLIAAGLYAVARHNPLKSLLAVTPVVVLIWLPHTEFVPDPIEIPAVAITWLMAALAAAVVLRLGDWRAGMWLMLAASALIGLPYAYIGIYHGGQLPFSAPGPSPLEVMRDFTPYYLMACTLVVGPLLAASYRAVGRQAGRGGGFCYHLALSGILLVLGATLGSFFLETDGRLYQANLINASWIARVGWLGMLLYVMGAISVGWLAYRRKALSNWAQFALLSLLILTLPLVLMQPVSTGWGVTKGFIGSLLRLYELIPSLNFVLGFTWLLLAGWLLTRRPSPPKMQIA